MIKTNTSVRRWVSNWSVSLLCWIHSVFLRRKCIEKSCRKLISCKPENGIPWLFTDFANIKDFPGLLKKFPDFSLTFKNFVFPWLFLDRGNPVYGWMANWTTVGWMNGEAIDGWKGKVGRRCGRAWYGMDALIGWLYWLLSRSILVIRLTDCLLHWLTFFGIWKLVNLEIHTLSLSMHSM